MATAWMLTCRTRNIVIVAVLLAFSYSLSQCDMRVLWCSPCWCEHRPAGLQHHTSLKPDRQKDAIYKLFAPRVYCLYECLRPVLRAVKVCVAVQTVPAHRASAALRCVAVRTAPTRRIDTASLLAFAGGIARRLQSSQNYSLRCRLQRSYMCSSVVYRSCESARSRGLAMFIGSAHFITGKPCCATGLGSLPPSCRLKERNCRCGCASGAV